MRTIHCDRCKREITGPRHWVTRVSVTDETKKENNTTEYDLCWKCSGEFGSFMKGVCENENAHSV